MSTAKHEGHEGHSQVDQVEDECEPSPAQGDSESTPSLLELLLAQSGASPPPLASRVDGIVLGRVTSVDDSGTVHVAFAGSPEEGFAARSMVLLREDDRGHEVALMFEGGDPKRPVVMGKMVSPLAAGDTEATADGRRVEIDAEEEIVLRCGEASLTLTRAGKIILRGAYVLSRSSGVNRIQGGSVEIN